MFQRKNKAPAGFRIGGDMYVRIDVVLSVIDEATKHALKDWDNQSKSALQERLDSGAEVSVRQYKANAKEVKHNLEVIARSIKYAVDSLEEA